jgi:hypothetical protein
VVEPIPDMPAGTHGFRLSGRLTHDEYFQILNPIQEQLERGDQVSFLIETAADFGGLEASAMWEDVKRAPSLGFKHRAQWERLAVVTDKDWMRRALAAFGWLVPGELRVFEPGELEQAKAWVGGGA